MVLMESEVINEFLEDMWPQPSLMPDEPRARAKVGNSCLGPWGGEVSMGGGRGRGKGGCMGVGGSMVAGGHVGVSVC